MEVLFFICTLNLAHNELQEQDHLQEEVKKQTSEIGFQTSEYCMYSLFLCYITSCILLLYCSYSLLHGSFTFSCLHVFMCCQLWWQVDSKGLMLLNHNLGPSYCSQCFNVCVLRFLFFVCFTALSQMVTGRKREMFWSWHLKHWTVNGLIWTAPFKSADSFCNAWYIHPFTHWWRLPSKVPPAHYTHTHTTMALPSGVNVGFSPSCSRTYWGWRLNLSTVCSDTPLAELMVLPSVRLESAHQGKDTLRRFLWRHVSV